MGWRQVVRAMEVDRRRSEREAVRRHRELQKRLREVNMLQEKERAAAEVEQYENHLEMLVSLHKDCAPAWDWTATSKVPAPPAPPQCLRHQAEVQTQIEGYRPTFFGKLFGTYKKEIAWLEQKKASAALVDAKEDDQAKAMHEHAVSRWRALQSLAVSMIARDARNYGHALVATAAFDEITAFGTQVTLASVEPDAACLVCEILDDDIVPSEELRLTAGCKVSTKSMSTGKYWLLYQDYVCSAAIRVAREALASLPVNRVVVNVSRDQTNSTTGHRESVTLLAVHFSRVHLGQLNMAHIDPSDAMKNFPHRMKFKKTVGFEGVSPMSLDEQWVTAG